MVDRPILKEEDIRKILPERKRTSHKGENGYAILFAGSEQYTGASLMSAAAAIRAGCGVLTVAVPGVVKPLFNRLPEVCCIPVSENGFTRNHFRKSASHSFGCRWFEFTFQTSKAYEKTPQKADPDSTPWRNGKVNWKNNHRITIRS